MKKNQGKSLKNEDEKISEGLNQIFEIINAKGDAGELKEIVEKTDQQ
ncbi:hypothetical protein [Neobacillus niacini]|nr:hypothetical protein [Neobacillus niacini]MCM3763545.1 hypothetical protein [Neobacillus niacini]